jgi:hypothetical protein
MKTMKKMFKEFFRRETKMRTRTIILLANLLMLFLAVILCWSNGLRAGYVQLHPLVKNSYPTANETAAPVNRSIIINFNQRMDPDTVNPSTFTLSDGINLVPGEISCKGNSAVFTPLGNLAPNTAYHVMLARTVKNFLGNSMTEDYTLNFNTSAEIDQTPPRVLATFPRDNSEKNATKSEVTIIFSEPVDPASISQNSCLLMQSSNVVRTTQTFDGMTLILRPLDPLEPDLTYAAMCGRGLKDMAGNYSVNAQAWSFKTASVAGPHAGVRNPSLAALENSVVIKSGH